MQITAEGGLLTWSWRDFQGLRPLNQTEALRLALEWARAPVFISYASVDRAHAVQLAEQLAAVDIPSWLDRRSIAGGASWDEEIVRGIKASRVVAVLCSPAAMASDNVRQELRLAMQYKKALLPLLLQPAAFPESVAYVLAGRQWVELLDRDAADWLPDVLTALQRLR